MVCPSCSMEMDAKFYRGLTQAPTLVCKPCLIYLEG